MASTTTQLWTAVASSTGDTITGAMPAFELWFALFFLFVVTSLIVLAVTRGMKRLTKFKGR